jgi:hypothetical protein
MPKTEPKKVVYLFGAGATHAELQNTEPDLIDKNQLGLHGKAGMMESVKNVDRGLADSADGNQAFYHMVAEYKHGCPSFFVEGN